MQKKPTKNKPERQGKIPAEIISFRTKPGTNKLKISGPYGLSWEDYIKGEDNALKDIRPGKSIYPKYKRLISDPCGYNVLLKLQGGGASVDKLLAHIHDYWFICPSTKEEQNYNKNSRKSFRRGCSYWKKKLWACEDVVDLLEKNQTILLYLYIKNTPPEFKEKGFAPMNTTRVYLKDVIQKLKELQLHKPGAKKLVFKLPGGLQSLPTKSSSCKGSYPKNKEVGRLIFNLCEHIKSTTGKYYYDDLSLLLNLVTECPDRYDGVSVKEIYYRFKKGTE